MVQADDAARFAAAKRSSTYREAIEAGPPPRAPIRSMIVMLSVMALLFGGLTIVLVATNRAWLAIMPAAVWVFAAVMMIRDRRAKTTVLLAIVSGEGAQAHGGAYGATGMSHFLILRGEDGTERTLRADPMAAAGLSNGDLGVATIRGGRVVAFAQITPPVDAT